MYSSRSIALAAIKGAVASELLYSPASDYDSQIEEIIPALLFNCLNVPVTELHEQYATLRPSSPLSS
jgi:hypothetical protein